MWRRNTHTNADSSADADTIANAGSDTDANAIASSDADAIASCDADANASCDADANASADADTDPDAKPGAERTVESNRECGLVYPNQFELDRQRDKRGWIFD